MGVFQIINQTKGDRSPEVCTEFRWDKPLCRLEKEFTVKQGDKLSLYYDFGFDLQVTPNTKVHFALADQNVDAKISPSGADRMNNEGWVNPALADILLPGTFRIYAYDDYYKIGTTVIILTVEPTGSPTNGNGDRIDLNYYCNGCGSGTWCNTKFLRNGVEEDDKGGTIQIPCSRSTDLQKGEYLRDQFIGRGINPELDTVYANGLLISEPVVCVPLDNVQRKCLDASTIAVWNQVDCKYDTAPCSTGRCENGVCLSADTKYITIKIISNGNGQVKTSGGDNTLAVRSSITVPAGYTAYFEAVPAQGEVFQKFVSADGIATTTNPITLTINTNGTITAFFSGQQPGKKYKCVAGKCTEDATGTFSTNTCGGVCIAPKNDAAETAAILIAASIGAAILLKYKGGTK